MKQKFKKKTQLKYKSETQTGPRRLIEDGNNLT